MPRIGVHGMERIFTFEGRSVFIQVYHIGTSSEQTTSEGFRSVYPTTLSLNPISSLISFGPSTPVQSASAAPRDC